MLGYELPADADDVTRDTAASDVFDYIRDHEDDAVAYDGVTGTEVVRDVANDPSETYTALRKLVESSVVDVEFVDADLVPERDGVELLDDGQEEASVEPVYSVADHIAVGDVVNAFLER